MERLPGYRRFRIAQAESDLTVQKFKDALSATYSDLDTDCILHNGAALQPRLDMRLHDIGLGAGEEIHVRCLEHTEDRPPSATLQVPAAKAQSPAPSAAQGSPHPVDFGTTIRGEASRPNDTMRSKTSKLSAYFKSGVTSKRRHASAENNGGGGGPSLSARGDARDGRAAAWKVFAGPEGALIEPEGPKLLEDVDFSASQAHRGREPLPAEGKVSSVSTTARTQASSTESRVQPALKGSKVSQFVVDFPVRSSITPSVVLASSNSRHQSRTANTRLQTHRCVTEASVVPHELTTRSVSFHREAVPASSTDVSPTHSASWARVGGGPPLAAPQILRKHKTSVADFDQTPHLFLRLDTPRARSSAGPGWHVFTTLQSVDSEGPSAARCRSNLWARVSAEFARRIGTPDEILQQQGISDGDGDSVVLVPVLCRVPKIVEARLVTRSVLLAGADGERQHLGSTSSPHSAASLQERAVAAPSYDVPAIPGPSTSQSGYYPTVQEVSPAQSSASSLRASPKTIPFGSSSGDSYELGNHPLALLSLPRSSQTGYVAAPTGTTSSTDMASDEPSSTQRYAKETASSRGTFIPPIESEQSMAAVRRCSASEPTGPVDREQASSSSPGTPAPAGSHGQWLPVDGSHMVRQPAAPLSAFSQPAERQYLRASAAGPSHYQQVLSGSELTRDLRQPGATRAPARNESEVVMPVQESSAQEHHPMAPQMGVGFSHGWRSVRGPSIRSEGSKDFVLRQVQRKMPER